MKYSFGSNFLPADDAFDERTQYIENYSTGYSEYSVVDYWYEHMLFGRIDMTRSDIQMDAIYPASGSAFMKRLYHDEEEVFALNFVADAFTAMQNDVRNHLRVGSLSSNGMLGSGLIPKRGWRDPKEDYFSYIKFLYGDLIFPFMSSPEINSNIVDFFDFVEQFAILIERITLLRPFTRSEYLLSNLATPLYSGLAIEIDDTSDQGEDFNKILFYINDFQFETYRQLAANRGFNVAKNAPWRLVAIPYSQQMGAFMKTNGVTYETLTDKFYKRCCFSDIPDLKFYLKEFYNAFVKELPTVRVPLVVGKNRKSSLTKIIERDIMTEEGYSEEWFFDNSFWIRLYIYIRAKETNRDWNQYKFDQVSTKAAQFLQHSGEEAAYKFINKEVRLPWGEDKVIKKYRRGTFRFQRKRG